MKGTKESLSTSLTDVIRITQESEEAFRLSIRYATLSKAQAVSIQPILREFIAHNVCYIEGSKTAKRHTGYITSIASSEKEAAQALIGALHAQRNTRQQPIPKSSGASYRHEGDTHAGTLVQGPYYDHPTFVLRPLSEEVPTVGSSKDSDLEKEQKPQQPPGSPLIKTLKKYYHCYATVQLPVFEIKQSIKDCYIRLALVSYHPWSQQESSERQQTFTQLYGFEQAQAFGRLRTHEVLFKSGALQDVKPSRLFDEHDRVLVMGRAGIGKSTFCKKMIYDWSQGALWGDFDMVYWLPLRYLLNYLPKKTRNSNEKLAHFIYFVYKSMGTKEDDLPKNIIVTITEQLNDTTQKTLFLLDGYHEVATIIKDTQHRHHALLSESLLKKNYFILTSQPHATAQNREIQALQDEKMYTYELLGFTGQDIPRYIKTVFLLKGQSEPHITQHVDKYRQDMMGLLRRNPYISGIMHVPINLALLCSVWKPGLFADKKTVTMSMLYNRILFEITKRNHAKLKGQREYSIENDYTPDELKTLYHPIYLYLGHVALRGLLETQIFFDEDILRSYLLMHKIDIQNFFKKHTSLPNTSQHVLDKDLLKKVTQLGFWHWKLTGNRIQCEFLDPTFQKYFAAFFLVDWWLHPRQYENHAIPYQESQYRSAKHLMQVLAKEPNFEVVFWFCAGLLKQNEPAQLESYYSLLPPTHLPKLFWGWTWVSKDDRWPLYLSGQCLEESEGMPKKRADRILQAYNKRVQNQWLDASKRLTFEVTKDDQQLLYYLNLAHHIKEATSIIPKLKAKVAEFTSERQHLFYNHLLIKLSTSDDLPRAYLDKNKQVALRRHAAQRLLELGVEEQAVLAVLEADIKSRDYQIRHSAARLLIARGRRDVRVLRDQLDKDDYKIRQDAAVQLIELDQAKTAALTVLNKDLKDSNNGPVQQSAAMRLARLRINEKVCIELLTNDLSAVDFQRSQRAAVYLLLLGQERERAKAVLFDDLMIYDYRDSMIQNYSILYQDDPMLYIANVPNIWGIASLNLMLLEVPEHQARAKRACIDYLSEYGRESHATIWATLESFRQYAPVGSGFIRILIEVIMKEVTSGSDFANKEAFLLLKKLSNINEHVLPMLLDAAAEEGNWRVRLTAILVLERLKPTDTRVLPALLGAVVEDENAAVREAAIQALGSLRSTDAYALSVLLDAAVEDEDENVWKAAIQMLTWIARQSDQVLSFIFQAADKSNGLQKEIINQILQRIIWQEGVTIETLKERLHQRQRLSLFVAKGLTRGHSTADITQQLTAHVMRFFKANQTVVASPNDSDQDQEEGASKQFGPHT